VGRRGRPRIHDSDLIARLLAERATTGESYAALSVRSGIPTGTLSGYAARRRTDHQRGISPFLELVATEDASDALESHATPAAFAVIVDAGDVRRHVIVPAGFDERELHRLVRVLESRC